MRFDLLRGLLPLLGINAIPLVGVFVGGWSGATALSLYWCETLIGSLMVLARLAVHKALTHKRGYDRWQLGLQVSGLGSKGSSPPPAKKPGEARPGSFLVEFALAAGAFAAAHGLLLWVVLFKILEQRPNLNELRWSVLGVAAFQVLGFCVDVVGIQERPFAWARNLAQVMVNRVILVHLALVLGFWFGVTRGHLGFFGPFAVLKTMADVAWLFSLRRRSAAGEAPPPLLAKAAKRLGPEGGDFASFWQEERAAKQRLELEDEDVATV